LAGLPLLCVLAAGLSAAGNAALPSRSETVERIGDTEKAYLEEAFHLRNELGDTLWPGWGGADIPVIVYNEEYAFLVEYPDPPDGWITIPGRAMQGGAWERVPDDSFDESTYYRQRLAGSGIPPQAFTELVGERWVSSLPTREWMEIGLGNDFQKGAPEILRPVFPHRLAARLFLSAAGGNDFYVCALLHESFHAYQGILAQSRLFESETVFRQNSPRYPWNETADWQYELDLLAQAVQAESDDGAADLARLFLAQRESRRDAVGMDDVLVDLERLKEWEEGLAKYTELSMWHLAGTVEEYRSVPALADDPAFKKYTDFGRRWSQEIDQIRRMAYDEDGTRFYYTGFAQAVLLDRLAPDWRGRALSGELLLEELLAEAVLQSNP
jgi:hypothetical protein